MKGRKVLYSLLFVLFCGCMPFSALAVDQNTSMENSVEPNSTSNISNVSQNNTNSTVPTAPISPDRTVAQLNQTGQNSSAESVTQGQQVTPSAQTNEQTHEKGKESFAQPFQNKTITLSGTSVRSTMYFTRVDYWDVKRATFNFTFALTQLKDTQQSNITLAVNGVKFYSFAPKKTTDRQTVKVDIPLDLIQDSNTLTIEGQIVDCGSKNMAVVQTPANWMTIYGGSNVNFNYDVKKPTDKIRSFYNHFIGVDHITDHSSAILVPNQPTNAEMKAASYALTGISRVITMNNGVVPMDTFNSDAAKNARYQIVLSEYKHLPARYQSKVGNIQSDEACLKFIKEKNKYVLIVTSKDKDLLTKAGQYIANQELMQETASPEKIINDQTQIYSSELQFNGNFPLTNNGEKLVGPNHQEQVFFVQVPRNQTNSEGSYVNLNFRYSKNLDFKNSLITVYVNDKPIGSQALKESKADGDHFRIKVPDKTNLANTFVVKVAFDLNLKSDTDNMQTPWAYVENDSNAFIQSKTKHDVLFSNYPSVFIKDKTFNQLAIQLPERMNHDYFAALSNVLSLIGSFAESNVGDITFYKAAMSKEQIRTHNVIVLGTPKDNELVKRFNDKTYFKFNKNFTHFVSNEKLSVESEYGKRIGVAQLMFNPYNNQSVALFVTGMTPNDVLMATTQIATQAAAAMYKGDTIVVDDNGQQYDYRFKKKATIKQKTTMLQKIKSNPLAKSYTVIGVIVIVLIIVTLVLFAHKYMGNGKGRRHHG